MNWWSPPALAALKELRVAKVKAAAACTILFIVKIFS
jgi:hypothetical protein